MESLSRSFVQESEASISQSDETPINRTFYIETNSSVIKREGTSDVDAIFDESKSALTERKAFDSGLAHKMLQTEKLFKNIEDKKSLVIDIKRSNIFSPPKDIEQVEFDLPSPTAFEPKNQGFDYSKPVYLCRNCQVLLGYEGDSFDIQQRSNSNTIDYFIEKNSDFSILKAVFNYKIDDNSEYDKFTQIYCVKCLSEIGAKIKNEYYIYTPLLQQKTCHIRLGLFSLKTEELDKFASLVESLSKIMKLPVTITKQQLKKSSLKTLRLNQDFDACILIHKKEGRLLLTDTTGIYSELLYELNRRSKGNFLMLLTSFEESDNPQESESYTIYDTKAIETLATAGQQPLMQTLAKDFRIVTINEDYNTFQFDFIKNFLHKSLYKSIIGEDLVNYNQQFALPVKKGRPILKNQKAVEKALFSKFKNDKEFLTQLVEAMKNPSKNGKDEACTLI